MEENIKSGFFGEDEEELEAASNEDNRLDEPIPQSDGTICYTKNCSRHDSVMENKTESKSLNVPIDEVIEITFDFKKEGNWKKEFIDFYEKELAGKEIEVESSKHKITFRESGGAKRLAAKGVRNQKRAEAGKKLIDAVKKATLDSVTSTEHKEKESSKREKIVNENDLYYTFSTPVKINGVENKIYIYAMHRKSEENQNNLWFYEFSVR